MDQVDADQVQLRIAVVTLQISLERSSGDSDNKCFGFQQLSQQCLQSEYLEKHWSKGCAVQSQASIIGNAHYQLS